MPVTVITLSKIPHSAAVTPSQNPVAASPNVTDQGGMGEYTSYRVTPPIAEIDSGARLPLRWWRHGIMSLRE